MHKTKIGEFALLNVRVYPLEDNKFSFLFFDKQEELTKFENDEISRDFRIIETAGIFKDLNYLLNAMIKNKGTRYGEILFQIYTENYPENDQMKKVKEFWNKVTEPGGHK